MTEMKESLNLPESLLISVGDISADRHTAPLIARLKSLFPSLTAWGIGGNALLQEGVEILFNCQEFSSIGIFNVIKLIPFLAHVRLELLKEIAKRKPKAVLLVDYGGFNLLLAKAIRDRYKNLPIFYFITPQVWGSRPWRAKTLAQTTTKLFVIFPFEESYFREHGISAQFVGHPFLENLPSKTALPNKESFCKTIDLNADKSLIAIFPGSRKSEIKNLFPVILESIAWLLKTQDNLQFAISRSSPKLGQQMDLLLKRHLSRSELASIKLIDASMNHALMSCADLVWAKSGTTTLEVTLFGKPMLIFYRADWLSYLIFLLFKRVHWVGLPNLLAGYKLVPELIQLDCRAERFVQYTQDLLGVPALRAEISENLIALKAQLGEGNYSCICASEIVAAISKTATPKTEIGI